VPDSDEPSEVDDLNHPAKRRSRLRVMIGAAVAVVVVAVVGPFVYIHFVEGKAPPKLTLAPVTSADQASAVAVPLDGTWTVASGSQAGYRVGEVLFGQNNTAVGRTSDLKGSIEIKGATVTSGSFTADMTTVHSDQSQRDGQFRTRIMDTSQYPTATFTLTKSIELGTPPASGVTKSVDAVGSLTLRGIARPVTIPLTVEHVGTTMEVLGNLNLVFADWKIPNPSFAGTVTTQDHGTLEFLLRLTGSASPQIALAAPSTTTTSTPGRAAAPGGSNPAANQAFQACLAAHGVTQPSNPSGQAPSGAPPSNPSGGPTGQANPQNQAAFQACSNLLPAGGGFTRPTVSPTTVPSLQLGNQ
jgi:polyisoprenoid-binding protein YceI